jgi:hypothetical protein
MIKTTNKLHHQRMSTSRSAQNVQRANVVVFDRPLGSLSWLRDAVPMRRIVRTGGRLRVLPYIEAFGIRFTCHEFLMSTRYHWRPVLVFLHPEGVRMAYALAADTGQHIGILQLVGGRPDGQFSLAEWKEVEARRIHAIRSSLVTDDLRLAK